MANTTPQNELKGKVVRKNYGQNDVASSQVSISEEGVKFRSYRDGTQIFLSPEKSIQAQKKLGADIIVPLDILLANSAKPKKMIENFHRTHRWEFRSLEEHLKDLKKQAMYCVIHGGTDKELRKLSIQYLTSLPFQGIAIGTSAALIFFWFFFPFFFF
jgi:queuine tRNA-ribosyltransferase